MVTPVNGLNQLQRTNAVQPQTTAAATQQEEGLFETQEQTTAAAPKTAEAQTLTQITAMMQSLTDKIVAGEKDIAQDDAKIAELTEQLETLQNEKEIAEAKFAEQEENVQAVQVVLQEALVSAEEESQEITEAHTARVSSAIAEAMSEYKTGAHGNMTYQSILMFKLSSINIDTTKIEENMNNATAIGQTLSTNIASLEDAAKDLSSVNAQIKTVEGEIKTTTDHKATVQDTMNQSAMSLDTLGKQRGGFVDEVANNYKVPATGADKNTYANDQVKELEKFLNNKELSKLTKNEAVDVLTSTFGSVIQKNGSGLSIPKGHDDQSRAIFSQLSREVNSSYCKIATVEEGEVKMEQGTVAIAKTDPIGFSQDGNRFDFIVDRNEDGIFNNKNEFLGAKEGWSEMTNLDANKDGFIKGNELESLLVLNKAEGGANIASAASLGIDQIDLSSFQKKDETDAHGNTLAGVFDLSFKGQNVQATQTLDTDAYLQLTYGNEFGMTIRAKSGSADPMDTILKAQKSIASIGTTKSNIDQEIDKAKKQGKDYYSFM